jgi:hypothetical protein
MSLFEQARRAREHADQCTRPDRHAVAAALEATLDTEARDQLRELEPESAGPDSFPPPPVRHIRFPRGGVEN